MQLGGGIPSDYGPFMSTVDSREIHYTGIPDSELRSYVVTVGDMDLNPATRRELRGYAWNYFAFHADQRLRTFNFFLALITVIGGGLIAILSNSDQRMLGVPLAAALVVAAFIFWMLDERNHDLLRGSERALKSIEASMVDLKEDCCKPNELQLFLREEYETNQRKKYARIVPYFTYHRSFRWVFAIVGATGLALMPTLAILEYQ